MRSMEEKIAQIQVSLFLKMQNKFDALCFKYGIVLIKSEK